MWSYHQPIFLKCPDSSSHLSESQAPWSSIECPCREASLTPDSVWVLIFPSLKPIFHLWCVLELLFISYKLVHKKARTLSQGPLQRISDWDTGLGSLAAWSDSWPGSVSVESQQYSLKFLISLYFLISLLPSPTGSFLHAHCLREISSREGSRNNQKFFLTSVYSEILWGNLEVLQ